MGGGCNLVWGGDRIENTVFLVTQHGGRAGGDWRPHSSLGHSRSMMVWSPVLVGVVFLSVFPGPSGADRDMPKLADWKLCADEECSRKTPEKGREGGEGLD